MPEINQPQVKLSQTSPITCEECGCQTFSEAVLLRKVSPILTGTGQPGIIPIPTFICTKCGHVNNDMLPIELQSKQGEEE